MKPRLNFRNLDAAQLCRFPRFFTLLILLFHYSILAAQSEGGIQWTTSVNVGNDGNQSSIPLSDWLYDVIVTSSGII